MLSVWRILRKIAQKINSCNTDYFFHLSLVFQGIIHLLTSKKTNDSRCFQNLFAMRMINTSTQEMGKDPLDTNSLSNKWNWNLFDELVSRRKKICLSLYKIVFPTLISFFIISSMVTSRHNHVPSPRMVEKSIWFSGLRMWLAFWTKSQILAIRHDRRLWKGSPNFYQLLWPSG